MVECPADSGGAPDCRCVHGKAGLLSFDSEAQARAGECMDPKAYEMVSGVCLSACVCGDCCLCLSLCLRIISKETY